MRTTGYLVLGLGLALAMPMAAQASPILLASGTLGGTSDLSGLSGTLENGLAADFLGGVGSGLAWAGGNTFLAVPDRGPNATPYNSLVDDTVSYIARFHTLTLSLTANNSGTGLPFFLTPSLDATTLLFSSSALTYGDGTAYGLPAGNAVNTSGKYYFTGRSDNFDPSQSSTNPLNARFDAESIRLSADGKSVFVSDEYGPYVRQFDRATGELIKTFTIPGNLEIGHLAPTVAAETNAANNTSGRTTNKGMEGIAITPDGKYLLGAVQAATLQDAADPATSKMIRLVLFDVETGQPIKEIGYKLTDGSGVSDIVALNDHQFLVDERDGKGLGDGSNAKYKEMFIIDISGATDITSLHGAPAADASVTKSGPFVDLVAALVAAGVPKSQIPSKIEGLAFGEDVDVNGTLMHTLFISDDNDFLPATSGDNHFYVFGFTDGDLAAYGATFQQQQFSSAVPEPATWAMMIGGFALAGAAMRRKARVRFA